MPRATVVLVVLLTLVGAPSWVGAQEGSQPLSLAALLPLVAEPPPLTVSGEGARSGEVIAGTFLDPASAAQQLGVLGWQENAYRYFATPAGSITSGGTTSIEVSLHRFATPAGAGQALPVNGVDDAKRPHALPQDFGTHGLSSSTSRATTQPPHPTASFSTRGGDKRGCTTVCKP